MIKWALVCFCLLIGQTVLAVPEGENVLSVSWLSILPPLITILLALLLREVILSLVIGILVGLIIVAFPQYGVYGAGTGFLEIPLIIRSSLFSEDHLSVILFTLFIGGMVMVISKNGGMMALVRLISSKAKTTRSTLLATWGLGLAIFFDDYANTLVVGKTMQPLTDRVKVSREKLSYIVDSTAAPVAAIAFITTWIGAELGYIKDGLNAIPNGLETIGSAYAVFFHSLQYSFYPILTIFFMFLIIWKRKDFGPMYHAEIAARNRDAATPTSQGDVSDVDDVPKDKERLLSALIPIGVLIFGAIAGLLFTGMQAVGWNEALHPVKNLANLIGGADSYKSLIWASFSGLAVSVLLTVAQGIHSVQKSVDFSLEGIKLMIPAVTILILAWTLSAVTDQMHTAQYLSGLVEGWLNPKLLPTIVFILSATIAFSTGTSWGTMSILYPIVLVTSWELCLQAGISTELSITIFSAVVSSVLAGAVLGDHCSPISDTTILSSMATECDHMAHVSTQLPYALTVGGVAIVFGILPSGFGWPGYITFPVCALSLYLIVSYLGKMVPDAGNPR